MLGILDPNEIEKEMEDLMNGKYVSKEIPPFTYKDILAMDFKLLTTSDFFRHKPDRDKSTTEDTHYKANGKEYPIWEDIREDLAFDQEAFVTANGIDIKIAGIIRPKEGATATSVSGAIGYTKALTDYILDQNAKSEVINQQKATPDNNVLTGFPFERTVYDRENIMELIHKIDAATMDMFYSYMTGFIKESEETSSLLNVTRANINTMFMLLPEDQQADIEDHGEGSHTERQNLGKQHSQTRDTAEGQITGDQEKINRCGDQRGGQRDADHFVENITFFHTKKPPGQYF
jgi:hypothetical protein